MDWSRYYVARWRLYRVDPDTWGDAERIGTMSSAKIDESLDKQEVQNGSIVAIVDDGADVPDSYYRLVMEAQQDGSAERVDVATLFCTNATSTHENRVRKATMTMSSVLYPASVRTVPDGTFLAAGDDAVAFCATLLRTCIAAPVTTVGSFTFNEHLVMGGGTTVLQAVRQILDRGGYRIRIDGRGNVELSPLNGLPSVTIADAAAAFLQDGVRSSDNLSSIPNHLIAVKDGVRAEAYNDDVDSRTSTARRGYVHDHYERSPQLVGGETLQGYADRRLEELSVLKETRTYKRGYMPNVRTGDLLLAGMQKVGLEGAFRSVRQSITCGTRISVEETVQREEQLWRA